MNVRLRVMCRGCRDVRSTADVPPQLPTLLRCIRSASLGQSTNPVIRAAGHHGGVAHRRSVRRSIPPAPAARAGTRTSSITSGEGNSIYYSHCPGCNQRSAESAKQIGRRAMVSLSSLLIDIVALPENLPQPKLKGRSLESGAADPRRPRAPSSGNACCLTPIGWIVATHRKGAHVVVDRCLSEVGNRAGLSSSISPFDRIEG